MGRLWRDKVPVWLVSHKRLLIPLFSSAVKTLYFFHCAKKCFFYCQAHLRCALHSATHRFRLHQLSERSSAIFLYKSLKRAVPVHPCAFAFCTINMCQVGGLVRYGRLNHYLFLCISGRQRLVTLRPESLVHPYSNCSRHSINSSGSHLLA